MYYAIFMCTSYYGIVCTPSAISFFVQLNLVIISKQFRMQKKKAKILQVKKKKQVLRSL